MLDFEAIANASRLHDDSSVKWSDSEVPLHQRGVRLEWVIDFLKEVDRSWREVVSRHEEQQRASNYVDSVPWPDPLPVRPSQEMTPEFLVEYAVRPMTALSRAPLFARVPDEHRGHPDCFVSHAWSNPLIGGNAFATLYAVVHSYSSGSRPTFVWLDLICYNQHRVEAVAADMNSVIASIGRVALPMINAVPFSRLWCLWELLCAHVTGADVGLWEANGSVYDLGYLARQFENEFVSVECAGTSLETDRRQILEAMVATFGSIHETDEHVRRLVLKGLSQDSDKPWNRPR
jgi:hypothetical protein